jgi:hypothetical protein
MPVAFLTPENKKEWHIQEVSFNSSEVLLLEIVNGYVQLMVMLKV